MKKIKIRTEVKKMLADLQTPVGIYLRLRDQFRDTILLESTDYHAAENSYSFICVNAIAGIEITNEASLEMKLPEKEPERISIDDRSRIPDLIWDFMQHFECELSQDPAVVNAQGVYGYTCFDAVRFFDTVNMPKTALDKGSIPLMRYRLYQYVIAINHFKNELYLCENKIGSLPSQLNFLESLIAEKNIPSFSFQMKGDESSNMTDEDYKHMVEKGIDSCKRGDVFQIVLSRRFQQSFIGDEFNVYRALRSINPSPYLFYFDYGDYRLMGSSPESQLIIKGNTAISRPIAGTVKRTGDDKIDEKNAQRLLKDVKENAEHIMLVDLARNDLSRLCDDVHVVKQREIQFYSHVIHLVSEVIGTVKEDTQPFNLLSKTFPAGTLSGAPKFKALELIDAYEPTPRSYFGGTLGFLGFNGDFNHAIMIRSFLCRNNSLVYQAGAGIVARSQPEGELQEVNNKLNALKAALKMAEKL